MTDIRDQYRQAIKPLSKSPKDFESWITNWEQIMAKGIDRNIPFATQPVEWFNDFLVAVAQIDPAWVRACRLARMPEVQRGTLTYRALANDFRDAIKSLGFNAKLSKIAKGSFGPTFAGQEADETGGPNTKTNSTNDKRNQKGKRRRAGTNATACRACEQIHGDLRNCFYLFPSKAPTGFRLHRAIKSMVNQKLKDDEVLAEEVKRLQKSMDKGNEAAGGYSRGRED
jgi:hypothetical protein